MFCCTFPGARREKREGERGGERGEERKREKMNKWEREREKELENIRVQQTLLICCTALKYLQMVQHHSSMFYGVTVDSQSIHPAFQLSILSSRFIPREILCSQLLSFKNAARLPPCKHMGKFSQLKRAGSKLSTQVG